MSKGRNAAKAFRDTRGARMADMRARSEAQKAAERAAGTRRTMMVVAVDDVQQDDEVVAKGGGWVTAGDVDRSEWDTADGQTFVRRFMVGD